MLVLIYKLYNANDCYIGSTKHPLHNDYPNTNHLRIVVVVK